MYLYLWRALDKVIYRFWTNSWWGVEPRSVSSKLAISRTWDWRGGAPRVSIKTTHLTSDSSSFWLNLWLLARSSDRFTVPLRREASVECGTLNWRAASRIEGICFFWIASIANKSLPSCSVDFLADWERIGGMVGDWREWVRDRNAILMGLSTRLHYLLGGGLRYSKS